MTPLIESAQMYPTLERAIMKARESVWFAFRVLDPDTKVRSKEAQAAGFETWKDLLLAAVDRGVEIRILLTDFEPVMADYLHAGSWRSFRVMERALEERSEDVRRRFQMIVIQHVGEMGWGWRQIFRLALRQRVKKLVGKLTGRDSEDDRLDVRPGLWRWVNWQEDGATAWKPGPPPRLWPATYHQKCAVIDGESAIVGGLDLDERRWDDSHHHRAADQTWHDISSMIEGPVVGDVVTHFVTLWNAELPRFRQIVDEWTGESERRLTSRALDPLDEAEATLPGDAGNSRVQLLRTVSRKSTSSFALGPRVWIRELKEGHRTLIGSATRTLYIEAQFFRSAAAADWVVDALDRNPELEVVIVIANVPEEVAFLGQGARSAHRHGEYLQARALSRLLKKGGMERVGLFTLVKNAPLSPAERKYRKSRGTAYGSGLIHIHAKLLIADDKSCLMSSANINGRSFEWDNELGFLWQDEAGSIARFREELWRQLFGGALLPNAGLAEWRHFAEQNRLADPEDRQGFVVPYQRSRARRFGNPYIWIPDSLV